MAALNEEVKGTHYNFVQVWVSYTHTHTLGHTAALEGLYFLL